MAIGDTNSYAIIRVGGDSAGEPASDGAGDDLPSGISRHKYQNICLLILGHCLLDDGQREAALAAAVSDGDLARVATWPGAYSAIVVRRQAVTVYADLSEQFPLYYSQRGAEILISADATVLAMAHGRPIDRLTAAAHIACPGVLPAWQTRSPYADVSRVPGGAVLHATPGSLQVNQARVPLPVPGRSLEAGAALLRDALVRAVRDRCAGRRVSTDFSGGLDSTSIAFLAAACARPPVTAVAYHQPLAPAGDLSYAVRYAALDPGLSLRIVTGAECTLPFAGMGGSGDAVWGLTPSRDPHPGWLAVGRSLARLAAAKQSGASLHLTGEGGDAILMSAPSYLGTLARHHRPMTLLRHSGGYARLRQAAATDLVGQAVRLAGTGPRRALSHMAGELSGSRHRTERWSDFIAWWPPAGPAARWLTARSRRQLADLVADPATARALPAGASPADLSALTDVRRSGDAQRQLRQLAAPLGLELHAPFLDDVVIRAALSVPAAVRANPWAYKPLLGAALSGLLPAEVFTRRTKGDYAAEDYAGVRAALPALRELLRDSRLAAFGVIEPVAVLAAVDRMAAGVAVPLGPLNMLLATESWLRGMEEARLEVCA
jgi:asparagine synthase (glutamine-hydrolysing)